MQAGRRLRLPALGAVVQAWPWALLVLALLLGLTLVVLELRHRLRPASPLRLRAEDFCVEAGSDGLTVSGMVTIHNPHQRMEVMVPEIELRPILLGRGDLAGVTVSISSASTHARFKPMMRDQFSNERHRILVSPPGRCNMYSGSGLARKVYGMSYASKKSSKSFCQISRINGPVGSMTAPIKP